MERAKESHPRRRGAAGVALGLRGRRLTRPDFETTLVVGPYECFWIEDHDLILVL
ncbi:hypothetical protein [Aeromicrobium sp.]|uniref:hypothetical protein n=1 Tax=Aeromicrobium sp. TaxID=1871063 RepID=UPI002FC9DB98